MIRVCLDRGACYTVGYIEAVHLCSILYKVIYYYVLLCNVG